MKKLLVVALCLFSIAAWSRDETTWSKASPLVKKQLYKYLVIADYIEYGDNPLNALDEDWIKVWKVKCENGKTYDYIMSYAGDTEFGPLYVPGTLKLVGEISDGDAALVYFKTGEKRWIDCYKTR